MRPDLRHPFAPVVGVALALAVRVLEVPPPVRPVVLAAFLLLCPGAALVGNPGRWPGLAWWTVVVAASTGLSILVSTALLYAGVWTPDLVLAVLALGTALGAGVHLLGWSQEGKRP